jgi:hypothetical protein
VVHKTRLIERNCAALPDVAVTQDIALFQQWLGQDQNSEEKQAALQPSANIWSHSIHEIQAAEIDLSTKIADALTVNGAHNFVLELPRLGAIQVEVASHERGYALRLNPIQPITRKWLHPRRGQLAQEVGKRLGCEVSLEVIP